MGRCGYPRSAIAQDMVAIGSLTVKVHSCFSEVLGDDGSRPSLSDIFCNFAGKYMDALRGCLLL